MYNIPRSAEQERIATLILGSKVASQYQGKNAVLTLYKGYTSLGYKSNYQPVPARWLEMDVVGDIKKTWRYTGERYPQAVKHFEQALDLGA